MEEGEQERERKMRTREQDTIRERGKNGRTHRQTRKRRNREGIE